MPPTGVLPQRQQYVIERTPQNDDELWWSVRAAWGVKIPRTKVCAHHDTPFDAFADAYFARHPQSMWLGSRGFSGKTFTMSLLGLTEMSFLGAFVSVLGGSGAQAIRVQESMTDLWHYEGAPKHLLLKAPTKFDTELVNGGKARTLMASQTSVRGPHPSRLRIDEIDEANLEIVQAALGQPMRQKSRVPGVGRIETSTVFSSTHTYPDGPVTHYKRVFAEKGFPVFSWCYKETSNPIDGWLDPDEIERKRLEIPAQMWKNEYDILEPNFEDRALDEAAVEKMFDADWAFVPGDPGMYYQFMRPRPDRDYITGVDWAKSRDFTVITTWDVTSGSWKLAAFEKINGQPWPAMIERLNIRWAKYGGKVVSDATGIGNVINDHITYPPGAFKNDLVQFTMAGRVRDEMITEFVNGVEGDNFLAPRIKSMYDDFRFVTADDLYNRGPSSHLPDTIASVALAWTARRRMKKSGAQIIGITRDSPWKI